jgi:hypothetical protein
MNEKGEPMDKQAGAPIVLIGNLTFGATRLRWSAIMHRPETL